MSDAARMLRAFGYLQATSLVNAIRQRLLAIGQTERQYVATHESYATLEQLAADVLLFFLEEIEHAQQPGNFETDNKMFLKFACTNGFINIKELQLEGKKRMEVGEFLKGFRFA